MQTRLRPMPASRTNLDPWLVGSCCAVLLPRPFPSHQPHDRRPGIARGNPLMTLLRCVCWHALPLTGVTPAGFCSLASGMRFTYLISQSSLSDKLRKLLDDASSRDQKIPFRGGLLDLFGVAGHPQRSSFRRRIFAKPCDPDSNDPHGAGAASFQFRGTATDHRRVPGEAVELPSRESWCGPQIQFELRNLPSRCGIVLTASLRHRRTIWNCRPRCSTCCERKTRKSARQVDRSKRDRRRGRAGRLVWIARWNRLRRRSRGDRRGDAAGARRAIHN